MDTMKETSNLYYYSLLLPFLNVWKNWFFHVQVSDVESSLFRRSVFFHYLLPLCLKPNKHAISYNNLSVCYTFYHALLLFNFSTCNF